MIASQFLNEYTPLKIKIKKEREVKECHKVNYVIITIISREISDCIYGWGKRGIINEKGNVFFEKLSDKDYDNLNQMMLKVKNEEINNEHYNGIVVIFQEMAKKTLSDFQRKSNPELEEYLKVIYAIKFIENNVLNITLSQGLLPNFKGINFLRKKRKEIEEVFIMEYKKVSNSKSFDFDQFKPLFNKIKYMNWGDYKKFLEEFITED